MLAQKQGGVKDVQGVLGYSEADTTANVCVQPMASSVKQTLDAIYAERKMKPGVTAGA